MIRILAALAALAVAPAAHAATVPLFVGIPGTYDPGVGFTFEVRAPGLVDLGAYNVELVLTADPGAITALAATAAFPADSTLAPFGTADNFLAGGPFTSGNELRITLSDFTLGSGVATTTGTNDLLAVVTVTPGAAFFGPLTIRTDATTLQFDTSTGEPIPVDPPSAVVVAAPVGPNTPVPAPPGVLLAAVGVVSLASARWFKRRSALCPSAA